MVVIWEEKKRSGDGRCHENGDWTPRVAGGQGERQSSF